MNALNCFALIVTEHRICNLYWLAERCCRIFVNNWALPIVYDICAECIICWLCCSEKCETCSLAAGRTTFIKSVCCRLTVKTGILWLLKQFALGHVLNHVVFGVSGWVGSAGECEFKCNLLLFSDVSVQGVGDPQPLVSGIPVVKGLRFDPPHINIIFPFQATDHYCLCSSGRLDTVKTLLCLGNSSKSGCIKKFHFKI